MIFSYLKKKYIYIRDADYADDIALLTNAPVLAESLRHCLANAAGGIGISMETKQCMLLPKHPNRRLLETSGHIHQPRKQRLNYGKWHQYTTSKCMVS